MQIELYRGANAFTAELAVDPETGEVGAGVPLELIIQKNPIGCGAFVLQVNKEVAMIEARIAELAKAIQTKQAVVERVKSSLFSLMDQGKVDEFKNGDDGIKIAFYRDRDQSVNVLDEALIPAKYFVKVPATKRVDKKAIAEALKAGAKVKGAEILRKSRLEIKAK